MIESVVVLTYVVIAVCSASMLYKFHSLKNGKLSTLTYMLMAALSWNAFCNMTQYMFYTGGILLIDWHYQRVIANLPVAIIMLYFVRYLYYEHSSEH